MGEWHSKAYLDVTKKIKKVTKFLERDKVDVLFLQEGDLKGESRWEGFLAEEFAVVAKEGSTCKIIYRKSRFPKKDD